MNQFNGFKKWITEKNSYMAIMVILILINTVLITAKLIAIDDRLEFMQNDFTKIYLVNQLLNS